MKTNFMKSFFQRSASTRRAVLPLRSFGGTGEGRGEVRAGFTLVLMLALTSLVSTAQAKLNVVATTSDLASIAREIGGDKIEVTTLAKPTEDPHFVDAKPSFIVKLNHADVVIEGGAELEIGWLPALLDQSRNEKIVAGAPGHVNCSKGLSLLDVPATLDRSRGDIHAAGNPHFAISPSNAKIIAQNIAAALAENDAANAETYHDNLKTFTAALDAKLVEWQKTLAPFKGRGVVAYHDSWPYFARDFGLKIDLFLEPKPGIPPTPSHLAEVITKMKAEQVNEIIVDAYLNHRTAETVARETGATVVPVTQFPGGLKGTDGGYIALLDQLVNSLAAALGKKK